MISLLSQRLISERRALNEVPDQEVPSFASLKAETVVAALFEDRLGQIGHSMRLEQAAVKRVGLRQSEGNEFLIFGSRRGEIEILAKNHSRYEVHVHAQPQKHLFCGVHFCRY